MIPPPPSQEAMFLFSGSISISRFFVLSLTVISSNSVSVESNDGKNTTEIGEQFWEDVRTCVLCWKASDLQPEVNIV